jgi:uncharacterized membrane protein YgcG
MKRWFVVSLVVAAVAFPAAAGAATFKGVVVSVQPTRHAMVVAQANGVVRTVHAPVLRQAGTRVSIAASRLRDGSFGAARVTALGRATRARIDGVVVRALRRGYLVSAGGSVLRILSPTRRTAAASQPPLAPGTPVTATVSIGADDELQAEDIEEVEPVETEPVEPVEPVDNDQGEDQQGDVNEDGDQTTATTPPTTTPTTDQNEGPGSTTSGDSGSDGDGGSSGDGISGGDG